MSLRFHRFVGLFATLTLAVVLSPAHADDAEGVKKKIDDAKKGYDSEVEKFRKGVTDLLDKREADARKADARKAGNKKLVDQIKAEQKAFELNGELPLQLPLTQRQAITAARTKFDKVYTTAVKDLVRLKEDAAAEAVEKDQQKFVTESALLFGKRTHLTMLKPLNVKTDKNGFAHDVPLPIPKGTVPHGIQLYPVSEGTSQVSYNLGGKWAALRVRAGVPTFEETLKPPASELTFEVLGDDKSLWKSNPTNKLDDFQTCEICLDKVKVLTLRVHCAKSGDWGRACWFEPILAE